MKPTSLVLLFAATALAAPQAIVSTEDSSATSAAAAPSTTPSTTPSIQSAAAAPSTTPSTTPSIQSASNPTAASILPSLAAARPSRPLPTRASRAAASPSSSPSSILSNLNSAACKRVIAGNAATLTHIAKLKSAGVAVPPYLSGYLLAAKAAEAELGCSTPASPTASSS